MLMGVLGGLTFSAFGFICTILTVIMAITLLLLRDTLAISAGYFPSFTVSYRRNKPLLHILTKL